MDNRLVGYARVSTDDQTTRQQLDELKAAGCAEIFEDVISGKTTERAGLDACLETLSQGDTLVVIALDRIGRSTAHVIATVETLGKRGIGFRSLREPMFDTTSPTGEFLLTVFAGLAQLERRMISERTKSALAAKKTRGETLGRPVSLTPSQVAVARKMLDDGESASHVARILRVDRSTLYRAIAKSDALRRLLETSPHGSPDYNKALAAYGAASYAYDDAVNEADIEARRVARTGTGGNAAR
jgi:DNA invertase Pin-like site-specific DNA recombinase